MNELIKLTSQTLNNEEINAVDARELHEFLDVKSKFATWIKNRIEKYDFIEGIDYLSFSKILEKGSTAGRPTIEYYISLDMAKELSMVENNEKGKEARRYFIECEKQYRKALEDSIPKTLPDALEAYALEIRKHERTKLLLEEAKQIIEEAKPKVKYHDVVLQCEDLMTITQISQDYPISNQKLNKILAEEGIQYKDKSGVWCLYVQHGNQGYAQTSTHVFEVNGKRHAKLHLKWTQKGRLFIYDTLKARGILPICEQED